jgi:xylulokinase
MSASSDAYILTIDLGTSGPKVALFSTYGELVDWEFEETPLLLFPDGGAEQRPDDWWRAIKQATARLIGRGAVSVDRIAAVCCTAQWSGTVAVDRDGDPLMNAVIWMDSRGARYLDPIVGGPVKIEGYGAGKLARWLRLTGGAPTHAGKDPIAHILYIKHELPEIYRRTYKFLEPKDYLNLRLTGRFAASYESITLHWLTDNRDISNITYHDKLVAMSTIDRGKLPDLGRAVDILGPLRPEVAAELGLSERTPIVMGTPDLHSAAIGSGGVRDYEAHLYIGTSSWLLCHVPFKKTDLLHNMAALPSAIPGRYMLTNEQESAGACLTFLRDNLIYPDDDLAAGPKPDSVYSLFDRIAERTPAGSERLIFTPWLYGERTPIEDHAVRGAFYNMSLRTTRAHLIRAVFEGVAYNSRWLLGYVEAFIKRRLGAINMIGGGANSNVWCQIYADVLNRPIRQVAEPIHANARGVAFLAAVALGHGTFDDIPNRIRIANTYQPNPANRKIYDELFGEFVNIYKRNKRIHARLNRAR